MEGKPFAKLILDSGAYSAYTQRKTINLDDYISYIKRNQHLIAHYVNLDVIPGTPDKRATQEEVEDSAQKSYENLQYMKAAGLTPIPVFHQGERFYWLERLVAEGWKYIGISPSEARDRNNKGLIRWMDQVFTMITDKDGWPTVDTHGFGVMGYQAIMRYPLTTGDAISWLIVAGYGRIFVPPWRGGKFDFLAPPIMVGVSGTEYGKKEDNKMRLQMFGEAWKDVIIRFIEKECGIPLAMARYDYGSRVKINVHYFQQLMLARPKTPFLFKRKDILGCG